MNGQEKSPEPTMDEILASIRKIIADEPAGVATASDRRAVNPLLESPVTRASLPAETMPSGSERLLPPADRLSDAIRASSTAGTARTADFDDDLSDLLEDGDAGTFRAPRATEAPNPVKAATPAVEDDTWAMLRDLRPQDEVAPAASTTASTPLASAPSTPANAAPAPTPVTATESKSAAGGPSAATPAASPMATAASKNAAPKIDFASIFPRATAAPAPDKTTAPAAPVSAEPRATPAPAVEEPAAKASYASVATATATTPAAKAAPSPSAAAEPGPRPAAAAEIAAPPPAAAERAPAPPRPTHDAVPAAAAPVKPLSRIAATEFPMPSAAELDRLLSECEIRTADRRPDPPQRAVEFPASQPAAVNGAAAPPRTPVGMQQIADTAATAAARSALGALAAGLSPGRSPTEPARPAIENAQGSSRTLEDVVADMMRPLLQQWLETNMPRIMEKALRVEASKVLKPGQKPQG